MATRVPYNWGMKTGLYVHVPFCETKCGYCDFYSVPLGDRQTAPLVRAIVRELEQRESSGAGPFHTIFVGGGTPTLLPKDSLELLFERLSEVARRDGVGEFSVEANPATVDEAKVRLLVEAGVNRMSFGGQSFHQRELDVLERLHCPEEIAPGIQLAREGGIERINLDLIFGIPGQTQASWRESLRRAVDLGVGHLACYGLTYEPGTPLTAQLHDGKVAQCDNDLEADLYLLAIEYLASCGFEQYEISNFAKPGCRCAHNLIYWSNEPYVGVGPSAASYVDGARFKNVPHIETYISNVDNGRHPWREEERLSGRERAGETAMLQLRLNRGIDVAAFERSVGLDPLELYAEQIREHGAAGLLEHTPEYIRLTKAGRLLVDRVIRDFLPTPQDAVLSLKVLAKAGVAGGEDCRTVDPV